MLPAHRAQREWCINQIRNMWALVGSESRHPTAAELLLELKCRSILAQLQEMYASELLQESLERSEAKRAKREREQQEREHAERRRREAERTAAIRRTRELSFSLGAGATPRPISPLGADEASVDVSTSAGVCRGSTRERRHSDRLEPAIDGRLTNEQWNLLYGRRQAWRHTIETATPNLPEPVALDSVRSDAGHLLATEIERRADSITNWRYNSSGRTRSRRYEGFTSSARRRREYSY